MAALNKQVRADLLHSLQQVMTFYGKKLEPAAIVFWDKFFERHDPVDLKAALEEYTSVGKYCPRPVDIGNIIDKRKGSKKIRNTLPPPDVMTTHCSREVAEAWIWFIGRVAEGSELLGGLFGGGGEVSLAKQEEYLNTVNREARAFNNPGAIPDEFKIPAIWR